MSDNKNTQKKYVNYRKHRKYRSLTDGKLADMYIRLIKKFPRLNKKYSIILTLPDKAKVLDVWVGNGNFLRVIKKIRPDIICYGIDITDESYDKIGKDVNLEVWSWDKTPYKDNMFDLVICQHVLEHVTNPYDFFSEFKRITKSYVLVVTPNHKTVWLRDHVNFYSDPTHIRPYTKWAMKFLAKQQNLSIVYLKHERYLNVPWIVLFFWWVFIIARSTFSDWLANILVKRAVVLIAKK